MAYAAIVSLEQTIHQILNHENNYFSPHQQQQIISMNQNFTLMTNFLEDFPNKANYCTSLERRMRDLANQVENIIDFFVRRTILRRRYIEWISLAKFKFELDRVAPQIDSIIRDLSERIKEAHLVRATSPRPPPSSSSSSSSNSSASTLNKRDVIVGLSEDLLAIKERLCGEPSKLQVVSIVGMGGIGKTTLARNAYHDPLIIERFDIRAWVTVSQDYSAKEIISELLDYVRELSTEIFEASKAVKVYKSLKGRRYLIVMDDMWSTNTWDDIKMIFPDDDNGSRVILTTRLLDVGAYANPCSHHLHEMNLMGKEQSWDLLRQKVEFNYKEDCRDHKELENIGKEIARSCEGLPLAILVVAGILSTVTKTQASWEEIVENVKSTIAVKDGMFEKILSLSYTHLPQYLRPCFLYMGAFPEDYEIHVSKLIKLWVAEGFVKPSESRSFEEIAEVYLEDLVKRSLVMVSTRTCNGKIKSCRLHDLTRELCIRIAHEDKFVVHVTDRQVTKRSIKNRGGRVFITVQSIPKCSSTTRTIICFSQEKHSNKYLRYVRLLRVLDVAYCSFRDTVSLPEQVFRLFHLKYIALGYPVGKYSWHAKIPKAISNLVNLQTLIVYPTSIEAYLPCVVSLPAEIWKLPHLRHLVSANFEALPNIPDDRDGEIFALENLSTLSVVTNLTCSESIMKMIANVRKLGICYSPGEDNNRDYRLDSLVHLQKLEKLKVTIDIGLCLGYKKVNPGFPRTLEKLSLSGWGFPWDVDMMRNIGCLPNLQVLKLRDAHCEWEQWETNEGEFLELKYLLIEKSDLKQWITESSHFPRLKCIIIRYCLCLSEIPCGIGEIPTLELIEVKECCKSLEESAKGVQAEQRSYGNDSLEVRCMYNDHVSESAV